MDAPPSPAKPVASFPSTLLARKGGARPAMRPQFDMMDDVVAALRPEAENDLGWNDVGVADHAHSGEMPTSHVVAFPREVPKKKRVARRPRGSALASGGKAAFTLRLDAERYSKLRLACTLDACSAQALVTDALDRLLSEFPDLDARVGQVARRRQP